MNGLVEDLETVDPSATPAYAEAAMREAAGHIKTQAEEITRLRAELEAVSGVSQSCPAATSQRPADPDSPLPSGPRVVTDEMTEDALRGRAKALMRHMGWKPGERCRIHSMIELLVKFGLEINAKPETQRCNYPECGCDFDAICEVAIMGAGAGDLRADGAENPTLSPPTVMDGAGPSGPQGEDSVLVDVARLAYLTTHYELAQSAIGIMTLSGKDAAKPWLDKLAQLGANRLHELGAGDLARLPFAPLAAAPKAGQ